MHEYLWEKINNSVEDDWKIIKPNYSFNVPLKIENDEITSFAKNKLYSIFGDYMYNGFQNIIEMPKNSNMFLHNDEVIKKSEYFTRIYKFTETLKIGTVVCQDKYCKDRKCKYAHSLNEFVVSNRFGRVGGGRSSDFKCDGLEHCQHD